MGKRNLRRVSMLAITTMMLSCVGVSAASRYYTTAVVTGIPGDGESKVLTQKNYKATIDFSADKQ